MFKINDRGLRRWFSKESSHRTNGGYRFDPQNLHEREPEVGGCAYTAGLKKVDL